MRTTCNILAAGGIRRLECVGVEGTSGGCPKGEFLLRIIKVKEKSNSSWDR